MVTTYKIHKWSKLDNKVVPLCVPTINYYQPLEKDIKKVTCKNCINIYNFYTGKSKRMFPKK